MSMQKPTSEQTAGTVRSKMSSRVCIYAPSIPL